MWNGLTSEELLKDIRSLEDSLDPILYQSTNQNGEYTQDIEIAFNLAATHKRLNELDVHDMKNLKLRNAVSKIELLQADSTIRRIIGQVVLIDLFSAFVKEISHFHMWY